jgi:hypothetical protein
MARGDHGLPKVSPGPAMPYPSMPYRQATPETALQPFMGWTPHAICYEEEIMSMNAFGLIFGVNE